MTTALETAWQRTAEAEQRAAARQQEEQQRQHALRAEVLARVDPAIIHAEQQAAAALAAAQTAEQEGRRRRDAHLASGPAGGDPASVAAYTAARHQLQGEVETLGQLRERAELALQQAQWRRQAAEVAQIDAEQRGLADRINDGRERTNRRLTELRRLEAEARAAQDADEQPLLARHRALEALKPRR